MRHVVVGEKRRQRRLPFSILPIWVRLNGNEVPVQSHDASEHGICFRIHGPLLAGRFLTTLFHRDDECTCHLTVIDQRIFDGSTFVVVRPEPIPAHSSRLNQWYREATGDRGLLVEAVAGRITANRWTSIVNVAVWGTALLLAATLALPFMRIFYKRLQGVALTAHGVLLLAALFLVTTTAFISVGLAFRIFWDAASIDRRPTKFSHLLYVGLLLAAVVFSLVAMYLLLFEPNALTRRQ